MSPLLLLSNLSLPVPTPPPPYLVSSSQSSQSSSVLDPIGVPGFTVHGLSWRRCPTVEKHLPGGLPGFSVCGSSLLLLAQGPIGSVPRNFGERRSNPNVSVIDDRFVSRYQYFGAIENGVCGPVVFRVWERRS
ncbi:hypothetical protein U1Q18_028527 [Sarracenia purpurea var. burkii]